MEKGGGGGDDDGERETESILASGGLVNDRRSIHSA